MSGSLPITLALVAYNKVDVIGLAIESAARGSRPPDLLVISDDGSDDGTPDVAEATARREGIDCQVLRHPRVGVYRIQAMRNACAAHALEGVVYLSDSDCIFGEHAIESHVELHRRHPRAVGTGPRYEYLDGMSGPFTSTSTTLEFAHFPHGTHAVPVGANMSFRRSLWRELGGFDRAFDGSYGLEEFEFSARAERAGALCVSDPGCYVFHCPHETVFGGRTPGRNLRLFNHKYGVDHLAQEREFVARCVAPWYWSGRRARPALGDAVQLDEWGAPAGFVPPLHLQLSRTLQPLIALVQDAVQSDGDEALQPLAAVVFGLDCGWLAPASAALQCMRELQAVLDHIEDRAEIDRRLRAWLTAASAVQSAREAVGAGGAAPAGVAS